MDDQASKENPSKDFNKLDLSQLQGFSFGTQWTQDKTSSSRQGDSRRSSEGGERPQRRNGGDARRDRRGFRKPATPADGADSPAGADAQSRPRRDDRAPRRDQREGDQRGPRRDFRGPRRDDRRPGGYQREGAREFTGPYFSPYYTVTFYPEDNGFAALVKAIRASCRTYELFEIARVVIGKNDRFVAAIQRKQPDAHKAPRASRPQADATDESGEVAAEIPARAKLAPFAISIPDGLPFDNEDAAIAHVLSKHLDKFFDTSEVEVEPPKGNYQVINKCGVTGELLGPPNYHLYNQIVQQHHASRLGRMNMDAFRSRIETVRDPEVVNQWLEKMKKATRYTWKLAPPAEGATPISFDSFDDARAYLLANARDKVVRTVETARMHGKLLEIMPQGEMRRAVESTLERQRRFPLDTANALRGRLRREGFTIFKKGSKGISYVCAVKRKFRVPGQTFADSIDALIAFIEANPMVKASELPAKFLGIKQLETHAATAIAAPEVATIPAPLEKAVADETAPAAESQPAETAVEEVVAAETASASTEAAEETVSAAAEEAPVGTVPTETSAPAIEAAPETEAAPESAQTTPPIVPPASGSVAPFPTEPLSAEEQARLHRLTGDLRWLVSEGYVTEYIDGSLFTYPPMSEARKKEVENEDRDDLPTAEAHTASESASGQSEPPAEQQPVETDVQAPVEPSVAPEPEIASEPESVSEVDAASASEAVADSKEENPGEPKNES
ncbi:hypothetical protein M2103_002371 [Ereboglobus sp. PH5-5]|uniref:hypothetical protein n=1 Tax=Ereboglobus sp. PH5-5 TaxID=2940529 RepID=UPI002404CADC|nr:hypothetical protein [Ereboglobus sp. PH5-5]MDF9834134.1 hypothetical protein [Ereboglobus sp. PH5-5]